MTQTTISNPNFGPKIKMLPMMGLPMSKVYKTSKVETTTTTTIITKTTTIQTMTIRIKTIIRTTSNLAIKHNFFLATTTIPTTITTMNMIAIGS